MAKLVSTQIEQLREIGGYLRQLRLEQGKDLDRIANQIFIRAVLLQAIEEGQADLLPEAVFVQGFIRRYAEALGVDGKALSQEFTVAPIELLSEPEEIESGTENTIKEAPSAPPPLASASPIPAPVGPSFTPTQIDMAEADPAKNTRNPFLLTLAASLGLIVLVAGLIIWGLQGRRSPTLTAEDTPIQTSSTEDPTVGVDEEPEASSEASSQEGGPLAPTTNTASATDVSVNEAAEELAAPVVVTLTADDRSWMSVEADGRVVFEGFLEAGREQTWNAQTSIVMTVGNAGGVSLLFNGNDPIVLGDQGVVRRNIVLTPETSLDTLTAER